MRELIRAMKVSDALDDRRDRTGVPPELARVDQALSEAASREWVKAPADLRGRVMGEIERGGRSERCSVGVWRLRWAAMTAAVLALASAGVLLLIIKPGSKPGQVAAGLPFDAGALTALSAKAAPIASAADERLLEEARLIGDDTRRAMNAVLARLPMEWGR